MAVHSFNRAIQIATAGTTDTDREGTGQGSTTPSGFIALSNRGSLRGVGVRCIQVTSGVGVPPVRAAITVQPNGEAANVVKTGWIRAFTAIDDHDSVHWDGEIPLGPGARLFIGLRNDTGATVNVGIFVVEEM